MPTRTELVQITTPRRKRARRVRASTTRIATASVTPTRHKPRRNRKARNRTMAVHPGLSAYVHTLADPWCCPPVRLGWGAFSPTQLATLTARYTFATNADGSFVVACFPINGAGGSPGTSGAMYNLGTHGAATWASGSWMNANPVSLVAASGRVVSSGVRVQMMLAATAVPGMLFAGSIPEMRYADVSALSADALSTSPLMRIGMGNQGAAAISLPMDPTSFSFSGQIGPGGATPSTTSNAATTIPIIAGSGFPASTAFVAEYVLNIEYQPYWQNGSSICRVLNLDESAEITVQDSGLTTEQVSRYVRKAIGFAENVAEGAASLVGHVTSSARRAAVNVIDTAADAARSTVQAGQNTFRSYNRARLQGPLIPPMH